MVSQEVDCGSSDGVRRVCRVRRAVAVAVAAAAILGAIPNGMPRALAYHEEISADAVRRFDRFLDDHPWVARDLQRDPSLATNQRYLDDHRALREFLADYPEVYRALRDDPYAVLRRTHRLEREERRGREIGREELERFDRFMRDHPGVAHDLRSDPSLVNSRGYLSDHPSFRDFLRDHPALREELQDNPYAFIRRWERWREERSDRHRGAKPKKK